ncbi:MAG: Dyp-type peroxidase, partial [Alphaproteobacteria bacterium]|nr:Dyp-type peroxidase [Alphaproteobacteria bacterium]
MADDVMHAGGRDLTGYEDGTENPEGDAAAEAPLVRDRGAGKDGSRFVAVQQWVRDLSHFVYLAEPELDNIIGRPISDTEAIDDAPDSA